MADPALEPGRMLPLKYLGAYPADLLAKAQQLHQQGRLFDSLTRRYPQDHEVRSDRALYDYVMALKNEHLRSAVALDKVMFDGHLHVIRQALGTHTTVWRVQGNKIKVKREIRVATLFKTMPGPFLKMIVTHELAHLKVRDHDKAFYALCRHIEPDYHQLEFDFRLYLTCLEHDQAGASSGTGRPASDLNPDA